MYWLSLPQDTGNFRVNTGRHKENKPQGGWTLTGEKSGIHPLLRCPSQAAKNLKAKGQPTWVDSLRNKGVGFMWKEKIAGEINAHTIHFHHRWLQRSPANEKEVKGIPRQRGRNRQAVATQHSTYSDVGPNVGGGDYGAPRCPVRCESLNRRQTGYPGHRSNPHNPPPPPR